MKIIVAGGRDFDDVDLLYSEVSLFIETLTNQPIILSGRARGADQMGEMYADEKGIPVELFPAKWDKYGKSAGYKRNEEMARHAQALIAFWDGKSRGTKHMINIALRENLIVKVVRYH